MTKLVISICLLALVHARPDHLPHENYVYNPPSGSSIAATATGGHSIAADTAPSKPPVKVIKDERINNEDGTYSVEIEAENGIKISESGQPDAKNNGSVSQQGKISFPLPDGQTFILNYVANENGFQPESPFLPVAPAFPHPIPQFVLDQIEQAKKEDAQTAAGAISASGAGAGQSYSAPHAPAIPVHSYAGASAPAPAILSQSYAAAPAPALVNPSQSFAAAPAPALAPASPSNTYAAPNLGAYTG